MATSVRSSARSASSSLTLNCPGADGSVRAACWFVPAEEGEGVLADLVGAGAVSSGSRAATSVCAGAGVPACDLAADRVGTPAGLALAESRVPVCRSKFSTRRTRFRMIASRCRISFWSCSIVGLVVRARAPIEPGSNTPNDTSTATAVVLVSSRRARVALNRSFPHAPPVFPPTAVCRLSATGALQNRSVSAVTCSVVSAHQHAPRRSQRGPSAPRSQATCARTCRSSSCGFPMQGQRPARGCP